MAELGEGGARDHAADFAEAVVGPYADGGIGESEPDTAAAALDFTGEGAIVDQFVFDACDSADGFQRGAAHQDAASGGAGGGAVRIADPGRRVEWEGEGEEGGGEGVRGDGGGV